MGSPTNLVADAQLRCSGELSGCQRCLAKKIKCHFPAPPKSSGSTQNKGCSSASDPPPQAKAPSDTTESSTDDSISVVASFHEVLEDNSSFDFEASTFAPIEDADALLFTAEFSPSETSEHPTAFTTDANKSKLPQDEMIWVEGNIGHVFNSGSSMWASSEDIPHTSSQGESSEFCYACLAQAMRTHEAVEAAVWAQKNRVKDTNDILKEQKMAMVECRELLDCQKCSRQSAQIMLLLSICGKILGSLEAAFYGLPVGKDANAGLSPHQTYLKRRWTTPDGGPEPHGSSYYLPIYGMSSRNRRLDDEDELLVLQSLLKARAAMLDGLFSRLHIVITAHSWPAQQSLIRELQNRLIKGPLITEFAGRIPE